jgi:hypothetical protein
MTGLMLLVLLAAAPAMAEPPPSIDIRWEAPPDCPQENDVRERIQNLLGSGRHDNHLRAEGTITRMDRRFRLDLVVRVRDLVGTRSIEANSCEDLAGAAAVELGLLIHSAKSVSEPSRSGTLPPTFPPARGSEPSSSRSDGMDKPSSQGKSDASPKERTPAGAKSESKTDVEKDKTDVEKDKTDVEKDKTDVEKEAKTQPNQVESRWRWHALVQAPALEVGVGPLPHPAIGIGFSIGLEYAKWQWQLKGISWQRQSVPAPGFPGYGTDVDRIGAAFWGCREFRSSWVGLSPCLTVGLERVSARGNGRNIVPDTQHATEIPLGAGAQGRLYLASWIRLLLAVGGEIELFRPQISIKGVGSVYQFAPAALSAAVGLEWIL